MAITIHIIPENRLAIFCMTGNVPVHEISNAILDVTGHSDWSAHFRHLWYALPGARYQVDQGEVRRFEAATAGLKHIARGDRTAIVVDPSDIETAWFLLDRDHMKESREIRVFTSLAEAVGWLDVPVEVIEFARFRDTSRSLL